MLNLEKSLAAFNEAKTLMPGGVNSPVRSYANVDCNPPFIAKAKGDRIFDIDGNEYIDYVDSWGPMVVGHAHPNVVKALQEAVTRGTSYGAPTLLESELAKLVMKVYPSIEVIRMVNSGTEATMSALRLARGYTGRDKIVKFIGCYHGHSDSLLVKAGSGLLTFGNPNSGGVPADLAQHTLVLNYNDDAQVEQAFAQHGERIAAVIVEPVAGNMNLVSPRPEFLQSLRTQCTKYGSVLIFDEVMTGFRVGPGCAQGLYSITPDLTTLGKVIGGGMPVAAFGGKREIMEKIAPLGPVYQAGTLSGNPVAVAAGLATLKLIQKPGFFLELERKTEALCEGLNAAAVNNGIAFSAQSVGGMFGLYFRAHWPRNFAEVMQCNKDAFNRFFHAMLDAGHYFAPSAYEAGFVSAAHNDTDIAETIGAAETIFRNW